MVTVNVNQRFQRWFSQFLQIFAFASLKNKKVIKLIIDKYTQVKNGEESNYMCSSSLNNRSHHFQVLFQRWNQSNK